VSKEAQFKVKLYATQVKLDSEQSKSREKEAIDIEEKITNEMDKRSSSEQRLVFAKVQFKNRIQFKFVCWL
jgi:hypothetical protein